jgi:hypothetical protein
MDTNDLDYSCFNQSSQYLAWLAVHSGFYHRRRELCGSELLNNLDVYRYRDAY